MFMYSYYYVYVFFLLCMFFSVYSVPLCCSVHCLCVNVYCTVLYYCHRLSTQMLTVNTYIIQIKEDEMDRALWNLWGGGRNTYRNLLGKSEGKRLLERRRSWWKNNIKMHLTEVVYKGVDWTRLVRGRNKWQTVANTVINLGFVSPCIIIHSNKSTNQMHQSLRFIACRSNTAQHVSGILMPVIRSL